MNPENGLGPSGPRRRWRPSLSLRMLMVLVLLVGAALGWEVRRVRTQRAAVATIRAAGGRIAYDFQFSLDPERSKLVAGRTEPPAPATLRRWLGDDLFRTVASVELSKPIGPEVARAVGTLDGLVSLSVSPTTDLPPEHLAEMVRSPRLARIGMGGRSLFELARWVTGRHMEVVGGVASLREVAISMAYIDDEALRYLARLPNLRQLDLTACPSLTDSGVARALAAIRPGLAGFGWSVGRNPIPRTLEALRAHHPHLDRLSLTIMQVDVADFAAIGRLTDLTSLNFRSTIVTDEGLRHLAPLRRLRTLELASGFITDAGMATVRDFAELESLDLSASRVGDAGLANLAGLTRLKTLRLGPAVTDAGTPHLARLVALESLDFEGAGLTAAALPPLAALTKLKRVGLVGSSVTPAGVARLQGTCPDADVITGKARRTIASPNRVRANAARRAAGAAPLGPNEP